MNEVAREELIRELEHLHEHNPPMGTLFVIVRETPYMLAVTLEDGVFSLD